MLNCLDAIFSAYTMSSSIGNPNGKGFQDCYQTVDCRVFLADFPNSCMTIVQLCQGVTGIINGNRQSLAVFTENRC
jgi:hypothetical protein